MGLNPYYGANPYLNPTAAAFGCSPYSPYANGLYPSYAPYSGGPVPFFPPGGVNPLSLHQPYFMKRNPTYDYINTQHKLFTDTTDEIIQK